ncbi:MAG: hypothetical protein U1E51_02675 [Candidatus Binatia bacterium]|nr:hypothetical protein [Candidatus Binatia bacterium]
MNPSDMTNVYNQAASNEFHHLCKTIVHDGRDPYIVAEAMLERLVQAMREYQALWDAAHSKEGESQ